MTDATRFQFNDPSVPKAYDGFWYRDCSSPGLSYYSMKPNFSLANASSTLPLGPGRSHGWQLRTSGLRDAFSRPTSPNQCWILPNARPSHRHQRPSSICNLLPPRWPLRRENLMQSYVSKVFSSSQTEQRHCGRCVGS